MTKLPQHLQVVADKIEAKNKLFGYDEAAHIANLNALLDKADAGKLNDFHPIHAMARS